ncbi:hypothetical protein GCM10017559_72290 [Streptosporangium longisporum]|uniref:Uncharacterized protein n=1 Tax=Streptosporangium longisporum TaxID=46187 RepID=A0ABP6L8U5_9ACTN
MFPAFRVHGRFCSNQTDHAGGRKGAVAVAGASRHRDGPITGGPVPEGEDRCQKAKTGPVAAYNSHRLLNVLE